jgi:diaminopimelate epimerase
MRPVSSRAMRFEKWQAAGNAYLVIERGDLTTALTAGRVQRICHPDLGAGSDGILVLDTLAPGHARVQILNPDGSEAEFSGNGSRIAAGYVGGRDGCAEVVLETLKGSVAGTVDGGSVTVEAGAAALEGPDHLPNGGEPPAPLYTFVNLGNPHCVIESEGVDGLDLGVVGPPIEHHPWFPNRTNVEFYRPLGGHDIRMRVWERGAGETLSSGSGSSAAAVAAVVAGHAESPVTVHTDGGELVVAMDERLAVRLTGPVQCVHRGEFSAEFLAVLEGL